VGFSQVAAFVLLSGALLYFGSVMLESSLDAQGRIDDARREADARAEAARQGSITIDSATWQQGPKRFTILATNDGSVTFRADLVEIVVDGDVRTTDVTSQRVDGDTTDVWSPGTQAEYVLVLAGYSGSSQPSDLLLVTDFGTKAYWRA